MDLYSNPPESLYQTGITKWFQMPEGEKTIPAVSVSKDAGDLWNSGYTLLITLIFAAIGKLVTDVVLTHFPLKSNGNRAAMLVAYFNTQEPIAAMFLMAGYAIKMYFQVRKEKEKRDMGTFVLALALWFVVAVVFAASLTAGLLIPTYLLMGNVARVDPSAIFYFDAPLNPTLLVQADTDPDSRNEASRILVEALQRFNQRAATRALGTVEQNRLAVEDAIVFNFQALPIRNGNRGFKFEYSWDITGLDFGLQRAPELKQTVNGTCETQFDWYDEGQSTDELDYYTLFKGTPYASRARPKLNPLAHPKASFVRANASKFTPEEGERIFAIVPQFANRSSFYPMENDLWYGTSGNKGTKENPLYVVRRAPPALLCNEKLLWSYRNLEIPTDQLKKATDIGMKLSNFWWKKVLLQEFHYDSKVLQIGRALGTLSLPSIVPGFTENNRIQTPVANSTDDFKMMILSAYVASREVIRNTALMQVDRTNLQNLATYDEEKWEATGKPVPDERADFVLESSEIQTLSLRVLISLPCIFVVLWILVTIRRRIFNMNSMPANNTSKRSKFVARSTGFAAVQLYRYLDEEICGKRRWDGRLSSSPFIADVSAHQNVPEKFLKGRSPFDVIPVSAQYSREEKGLLNVEHVSRHRYDSEIKKDLAALRNDISGTVPAPGAPVGGSPPDPAGLQTPGNPPNPNGQTNPPSRPPRHRPSTTTVPLLNSPGGASSPTDPNPPPSTPPLGSDDDSDGRSEAPPGLCLPVVDNFILPKLVPMYHIAPDNEIIRPGPVRRNSSWLGFTPGSLKRASTASIGTHGHRGYPGPNSPPLSPVEDPNDEEWQSMTEDERKDWKTLAKSMRTKKKMVPIPDRYELAMTYVYRPQLKAATDRLKWKMVQEDAELPEDVKSALEEKAPQPSADPEKQNPPGQGTASPVQSPPIVKPPVAAQVHASPVPTPVPTPSGGSPAPSVPADPGH